MIEAKLERLAAAGIQFVPVSEIARHFVFERDGFVALVEQREDGFGHIGAAGLLSPRGLAPLTWRGERAFFVAKGFEGEASPEQVERLRAFERDLRDALS